MRPGWLKEYNKTGIVADTATTATNALAVGGAPLASLVQTTGTQSIAGDKTFTDDVICSHRLRIPHGAPASPQDGDVWFE